MRPEVPEGYVLLQVEAWVALVLSYAALLFYVFIEWLTGSEEEGGKK